MKRLDESLSTTMALMMSERPCVDCGKTVRSGAAKPVCGTCFDLERERRWDRELAAVLREVRGTLPARFRDVDFGPCRKALEARVRDMGIPLTAAVKTAEANVSDRRGAVLLGPAGLGKTTLAAAILIGHVVRLVGRPREGVEPGQGWAWASAARCGYVLADDLPRARPQHGLGRGEAPLILHALHAPVLVIDDLGLEKLDETMREVIAKRADNALTTIYTTSITAAEMAARYGDGVARRVYGAAPTIQLGGA